MRSGKLLLRFDPPNREKGNAPEEPNGFSRDMNFELRKPKLAYGPLAADASPAQSHEGQLRQPNKTRFEFKTHDFVVYPAHGVGQIRSIEEQTVAGASLEFFVIYFARSKMTLRAPTQKAAKVGMRRLSAQSAIKQVRSTLSQRPNKPRGNWSRLAQEYSSKINSGDIIALAEVLRDLYRPAHNPGQSFSERQLYASALDRLSGEVALVGGITEPEAVRELESLMMAALNQS
jgi:CarD family transcriptional regulator